LSQAKIIKKLRQEIAIHEERNLPEPVLSKLWLESFRYSLTRSTYAVSEFCDNYREYYQAVPERAKEIINKELAEAIADGLSTSVDQCDKDEWTALWAWITGEKNNR
jgi:hypothetical protein